VKDLRVGDEAYVVESNQNLISSERVVVELNPGCVWIPLLLKDERVGIAFTGSSHFAVDAITETDEGAMGESVSGTFGGIQIYLGQSDPASGSRTASQDDIRPTGYVDLTDLVNAAKMTIERELNRSRFGRDVRNGDVLVGKDSESKSMVLLLRGDNMVFTYDKLVYVVSDDGMITVGKKGLAVSGRHGRALIVSKDGKFRGLDCLDSLPDLMESAVCRAIGDISGRRGRRRHLHIVDDFDEDVHGHGHECSNGHRHDTDVDDNDLDSV
jgi:hypothetical protein